MNSTLSEAEKCKAILRLLETNPEALKELQLGMNPLHCAVSLNLPEVVSFFLKKKLYSVNSFCFDNITALHIAVDKKYENLIFLLAYFGCDFNAVDAYNQSALDKAIEVKSAACLKNLFLASHSFSATEFKINDLIMAKALDKIKLMQDFKEQHNFFLAFNTPPDFLGRTPLHLAALENSIQLLGFLLNFGIDVNERDMFGRTALHYAAQCGHTEMICFLRAHEKIDMNAIDINGNTAFHVALKDPGCVHVLITGLKRVDKNIQNKAGKTGEEVVDWNEIKNAQTLRESLVIKNVNQVDKDFLLFDQKIPANCFNYLSKNFKELLLENEGPSGNMAQKLLKTTLKKTTSRLFPSFFDSNTNDKSSTSSDCISDKNITFYEKVYQFKDVKSLVRAITLAQKEGKLLELIELINGFIDAYPDEVAASLLLASLDALQILLDEERADFYEQIKKIQFIFCKNLLAEGLDEYCEPSEIKVFTQEAFSALNPELDSIRRLKKLVEICSGNLDKQRNQIKIDLNWIRIQILGLIDFVEPLEIILLLIKLNPHLSNIQRLQSHFIVFSLLEPYSLFSKGENEIKIFKEEVIQYFNQFCKKDLITQIKDYLACMNSFEVKSLHTANEMIKAFLSDKIEIQKESILVKINNFVEHKHKNVGDITREFNHFNAQFFQNAPLNVFREKCWAISNLAFLNQGESFSSLVHLIKTVILSYKKESHLQARAIMLFLKVAQRSLYFLCPDMITIMAVVCAVSSTDIAYLKAFDLLDINSLKLKELICKLQSFDNNFKNYRDLLIEDCRALPLISSLSSDKIHIYEQIDRSEPEGDEILYNSLDIFGKIYQRICFIKHNLKGVSLDFKTDLPELLSELSLKGELRNEVSDLSHLLQYQQRDHLITCPKIKIYLPKRAEILSSTESSSQEEPLSLNRRSSEKKIQSKTLGARKTSIGRVSPRRFLDKGSESFRSDSSKLDSFRSDKSESFRSDSAKSEPLKIESLETDIKNDSPRSSDKSTEYSFGIEVSPRKSSPRKNSPEAPNSSEISLANEPSHYVKKVSWFNSKKSDITQKIDLSQITPDLEFGYDTHRESGNNSEDKSSPKSTIINK